MRRAVPLVILTLAACEQPKKAAPVEASPGATVTLVGIDPEHWTCDKIATPDAVGEAVGGHVREVEGSLPPPRGTPKPCNYLLDAAVPEAWTFDLDCRPNALRTAETLWKQYTEQNDALLAAYADAGADELKDDAGVVHVAPGGPTPVAVGAKGLDHNGQAVLFVDDDTPCYGRVVGPDPARRLALAQLVAKNLRPATAPMEPRPAGK
jgi:hypothetical protein